MTKEISYHFYKIRQQIPHTSRTFTWYNDGKYTAYNVQCINGKDNGRFYFSFRLVYVYDAY